MFKYICAVILLSNCFYTRTAENQDTIEIEYKTSSNNHYAQVVKCIEKNQFNQALPHFEKAYQNKEYEKEELLRYNYAYSLLMSIGEIYNFSLRITVAEIEALVQADGEFVIEDYSPEDLKKIEEIIIETRIEHAKKLIEECDKNNDLMNFFLSPEEAENLLHNIWDYFCYTIQKYGVWQLEAKYNKEFYALAKEAEQKDLPVPYKYIAHRRAQQNYILEQLKQIGPEKIEAAAYEIEDELAAMDELENELKNNQNIA